ncbi:sodium/chloride dependent transporter [Holotrichia oblita]|uniref:32-trans-enoyl-coa isomerase-related n=2 Tax=Holotrichia oblita TaxID=644536 RepID=A0ACB9TW38_HOLOL|nr:32-trans-enoyl-coa isomerase-related [Holotrichia oblita]KAI4471179.1 sodium/chloride dependent transporter [Holotrichia oblita]
MINLPVEEMSTANAVQFLINTNLRFLSEMKSAAELDSRIITLIPSIIFMIGAFALIFKVFHRRTHRLTPYKIRFYRELGFHWTYFYLIRIWFLVIKVFRWGSLKLTDFVKKSEYTKNYENADVSLHAILLVLLFACSLTPCIIVILKHYMRHTIPDFLMW